MKRNGISLDDNLKKLIWTHLFLTQSLHKFSTEAKII